MHLEKRGFVKNKNPWQDHPVKNDPGSGKKKLNLNRYWERLQKYWANCNSEFFRAYHDMFTSEKEKKKRDLQKLKCPKISERFLAMYIQDATGKNIRTGKTSRQKWKYPGQTGKCHLHFTEGILHRLFFWIEIYQKIIFTYLHELLNGDVFLIEAKQQWQITTRQEQC